MKDNKYAPYVLGPILLVVWGLVFYKIYQAVYGGGENFILPEYSKIPVVEGPVEESAYALLLDYKDPFLGKKIKTLPENKKETTPNNPHQRPIRPKTTPKTVNKVVRERPFPTIIYQGIQISEQDTIALLKINNRFYPVARKGERYQGVLVQHIYKDSIRLGYNNQNRTFIKKR